MRQFREMDPKSAVPISTPGSINSRLRDSCDGTSGVPATNIVSRPGLQSAGRGRESIYGHKNCQPHFPHVPSHKLGGIPDRHRTDRIRNRREHL